MKGYHVHSTVKGFRGFTAPASLKSRQARALGVAGSRFPGLYRPGLIEVLAAPAAFEGGGGSFRGFTAPASLKAIADAQRALGADRFRGFTAPASLKGIAIGGNKRKNAAFPGLYRPGLIEGST